MLKSEMQHQFWVTKKAVERKLGTKEDKFIISSDSELDSKLEIFKAISDTSIHLNSVIDQYQERFCVLSQETCLFGRFLKEIGKRSKTTGHSITNSGKAIFYSGQQMTSVRVPLLRLQHEVDVFGIRAVKDTQDTIQIMEKERTGYRAALSWIKSVSSSLDPDMGKSLNKFRAAQAHVRQSKQNFDRCALNTIQKIDLLAAARCNMFSHALLSYIKHLNIFVKKTSSTFETISNSIKFKPNYDFCVIKSLTQDIFETEKLKSIATLDPDEHLFFAEDYGDNAQDKINDLPIAPNMHISEKIAGNDKIANSNNDHDDDWTKFLENELNFIASEQNENYVSHSSTTKATEDNRTTNLWIELFAEKDILLNQEPIPSKDNANNYQKT